MSKTIIDVKHFEFRWSRITRNCCNLTYIIVKISNSDFACKHLSTTEIAAKKCVDLPCLKYSHAASFVIVSNPVLFAVLEAY